MFLTHRRRWKLSDSISLAPLSRWLGGGASKSSSKASTLQQSLPLATSRGSSSPRSKSVMAALALATALAANQVRAVGAFAPQLVPSAKVSSLLSSSRSPGSASPTAPSAAWDILGARDGRQQRPTPALARRGMCLRASAAADVRSATLGELALRVLTEGDSKKKVALSNEAVDLWQSGEGSGIVGSVTPPDRPERPHDVETVDWTKIQKRKPDADGQRITLLHAIAHIESYAMDLSWDIVARFKGMPKEFYDDWVQVAKEETLHFSLLSDRLEQLGSSYGAMPVHDGLWSAAALTKDDIRERLAIVHMVHEARGVDVTPNTINKFKSSHDFETAKVLERIYVDELTHVGKGVKWFKWVCEKEGEKEPVELFKKIVTEKFGYLKGPFNEDGRGKAGMAKEWYEPLVKDFAEKS